MKLCNDHAVDLFFGDPLRFRDELRKRPLLPYDQLEERPRVASPQFKARFDNLIKVGWKRHGITIDLAEDFSWDEHDRSHRYLLHAWDFFFGTSSCLSILQ